jgi:four helix bundle protein
MKSGNLIVDLSFQFSLDVIHYIDKLDERKKYSMSKQLFRSGTSVGANIKEAQFGESKNDFIHKLKISEKEAEETEYWLLLCKNSEGYPDPENLIEEIRTIKRVLGKIICTSRKNKMAA